MNITRRKMLVGSVAAAGALVAMPNVLRAEGVIRVGLIPSEDSRAMLASSQQLLDALEKNSGMKVQGFVAADYNGVIEAMRAGHIEVAYLAVLLCARRLRGQHRGVCYRRDTKVRTYVLSQPDHHAERQWHQGHQRSEGQDLRVRRSVFDFRPSVPPRPACSSSESTRRSSSAAFFSPARTMPTHWRSPTSVSTRPPSPTASSTPQCRRIVRREDIHVVWSSDPIPELPTVWRKNLTPELKAKIKTAFLNIKDITWADQGKLNRFVETNDAAYDVIRGYRKGAQSRSEEDEMSSLR